MKLTIAFILSSLYVSSTAVPVAQKSGGFKIALMKRNALATSNGVDTAALRDHVQYATAKYKRGFAAYHSHTGKAHPLAGDHHADANAKREPSSDPLINEGNAMWHGAITVGNPPQNFTVDFDTGSSDLILPSPACTTSCRGHHAYQPTMSSSSHNLLAPFQSSFGDQSQVYGMQYKDTVGIAGMSAREQTLGTALSYSSGFSATRFAADGLLGMAFKSISECQADPVFQTLIAQKQPAEPIFAFKLAQNDSELTLGGVNNALYKGEFAWTNVTKEAYWQVEMEHMMVNNNNHTLMSDKHAAIIDTGTTLLIGDPKTVAAFYAAIPGARSAPDVAGPGFYTFPCNATPSVSLVFSGRAFSILPEAFNLGPATEGSEECVGGVVASDNQKFWIVGDVFLRGVYTAFDAKNKRVGFAELA